MTDSNFIRDAEEQVEIGFGPTAVNFLVRLDPKETKPANDVVKQLVEDWNENFLLTLVSDAEKLRQKLDDAGVNLVVHVVARCVKPYSRELDLLLKQDILTLSLQNDKGNCALHYLAQNKVDLLGLLPIRRLLIRNLNGATPLHIQAHNGIARERITALPTEILQIKTKRGVSIESAMLTEPHEPILHEPILQEVAQARVGAEQIQMITFAEFVNMRDITVNGIQYKQTGKLIASNMTSVNFERAGTRQIQSFYIALFKDNNENEKLNRVDVNARFGSSTSRVTLNTDVLKQSQLMNMCLTAMNKAQHGGFTEARVAGEHNEMSFEDLSKIDKIQCGKYALAMDRIISPFGHVLSIAFDVKNVSSKALFVKVSPTQKPRLPGEKINDLDVCIQQFHDDHRGGAVSEFGSTVITNPINIVVFKRTVVELLEKALKQKNVEARVEARVAGEDKGAIEGPDDIGNVLVFDNDRYVRRSSRSFDHVVQVSFIHGDVVNNFNFNTLRRIEVSRDFSKDKFVVGVVSDGIRVDYVINKPNLSYHMLFKTLRALFAEVERKSKKVTIARVAGEKQELTTLNDLEHVDELKAGHHVLKFSNNMQRFSDIVNATYLVSEITDVDAYVVIKLFDAHDATKGIVVVVDVHGPPYVNMKTFRMLNPFNLNELLRRVAPLIDKQVADARAKNAASKLANKPVESRVASEDNIIKSEAEFPERLNLDLVAIERVSYGHAKILAQYSGELEDSELGFVISIDHDYNINVLTRKRPSRALYGWTHHGKLDMPSTLGEFKAALDEATRNHRESREIAQRRRRL